LRGAVNERAATLVARLIEPRYGPAAE